MNTQSWSISWAACCALIAHDSLAAIVHIDPDDFAAGTDISYLYPGVSLSATGIQVEDGFVDAAIFSTEAMAVDAALTASTGSRIFNVAPTQLFPRDWLILEFRADFAQPTDYVALDFIGYVDPDIPDSEDVGLGVLAAYNAADELLMQINTMSLVLNQVQTLSVSSGVADIAYITARRQGIDTPVLLDNLAYNAVPVPAALWLFGAGLVGLVGQAYRNAQLRMNR